MNKEKRESMVNDIENRLDDFFGDEKTPPPGGQSAATLERLKSLVLSIDWEITESCLTDLIEETDVLLPRYEADRYVHTLLRMLRAVGGYIRKRKAQAHQDAIKRVMSVFASIEQLAAGERLDESAKKRIVAKEILAFKKLKVQVDTQHGVVTQKRPIGEKAATAEDAEYVEYRRFQQAMSEVEERLSSQVVSLKAQLEELQKELDSLRNL